VPANATRMRASSEKELGRICGQAAAQNLTQKGADMDDVALMSMATAVQVVRSVFFRFSERKRSMGGPSGRSRCTRRSGAELRKLLTTRQCLDLSFVRNKSR